MSALESAHSGLSVFVDASRFLCAVAATWVDRLLLLEELEVVVPKGTLRRPVHEGGSGARYGKEAFAVWDLPSLLGQDTTVHAWMLLRFPHGNREMRMALRTGACLFVDELKGSLAVPRGLFTDRPGALSAVFTASELKGRRALEQGQAKGKSQARLGFVVDPLQLWTETELALSAVTVDALESAP